MFNVGIMGCGAIAAKMCASVKALKDIRIAAVASRDLNKAKNFAKNNCPKAKSFGSYDELLSEDLDLIYIATPNTYHYECAIKCIKAHKNVLVEKPFTMNRRETDSVFTEAKNRGVFICEAMWTAFMPLHHEMLKWISDGRIGQVRYITANLGYDIDTVPRLTDPQLGGGSYLDLGVYPTHLAVSILGENLEPVAVHAHKFSNGLERDISYILELPYDGAQANCYVTMTALTDRDGAVVGDEGYIKMVNINDYEKIELYDKDGELVETIVKEEDALSGYAIEMAECAKAIRNGLIQAPDMPWSRTACLSTLSDKIRAMI